MKKKIVTILLSFAFMCSIVSLFTQSGFAVSNETTVYNFLRNEVGLNVAAACGVLGNLHVETGGSFSPTSYNGNDSGGTQSYGVCQWNNGAAAGNRYDKLITWCNNHGYDYRTLNGQLHYMKYELETYSYYKLSLLRAVEDSPAGAREASRLWSVYYEGCSSATYQKRADYAANTYWPKYHAHSYTSSVTAQPGCTANGTRTYTCLCGATYTESIQALGHSWGAWEMTTAPTCTTAGVSTSICTRCRQQQTQPIFANGHSYTVQTTAATCTQDGYDRFICTVCGDSYTDNTVIANGHTFADGICTVCGVIDEMLEKGDINLDGVVSSADTVMLARYLVSMVQLSKAQLSAADLNNDGAVTSADSVLLARQIAKLQ